MSLSLDTQNKAVNPLAENSNKIAVTPPNIKQAKSHFLNKKIATYSAFGFLKTTESAARVASFALAYAAFAATVMAVADYSKSLDSKNSVHFLRALATEQQDVTNALISTATEHFVNGLYGICGCLAAREIQNLASYLASKIDPRK